MLANIVRSARRALFPEGWPGPPPVDPTPEEQVEMRAAVRRRLLERVPGKVPPPSPTGAVDELLIVDFDFQVPSLPCLDRHRPHGLPRSTPRLRRWTTRHAMLTSRCSFWTSSC